MINQYLEFERPIEELEIKIADLKSSEGFNDEDQDTRDELAKLQKKVKKTITDIYAKLDPWQITQVARHPGRPYMLDYVEEIFEDFTELHGDRAYKDDPAIVGGLATLNGKSVVVIGQQKGRNTKEKIFRNFAMPHPEGYRKALRLMKMAEQFNKPVITFIDTPGAYPGLGAEERGQSEAIATNLLEMSALKVPMISVVIGEGGSGGALALGVTDKIFMMEYSTYSVISPEGCAAILWKDGTKAELAAKALKINADELKELGIIDTIIKEPIGGAHRNLKQTALNLKEALVETVEDLVKLNKSTLIEKRYDKFRSIGVFKENN